MRIDAINRIYSTYSAQATTGSKGVEKVKGKDEVDLSNVAKDFASIKRMLSDVPEVREDKVQDIKQKMEDGTYDVSSKDVASKILSQFNYRG